MRLLIFLAVLGVSATSKLLAVNNYGHLNVSYLPEFLGDRVGKPQPIAYEEIMC